METLSTINELLVRILIAIGQIGVLFLMIFFIAIFAVGIARLQVYFVREVKKKIDEERDSLAAKYLPSRMKTKSPTPDEVAQAFAALSTDEKAAFYNALSKMQVDWEIEFGAVNSSYELDMGGRRLLHWVPF